VQVNRVDNRIFNAQNALTAATNEMDKPDTLVSKNTYIGASEQANINVRKKNVFLIKSWSI
jgi:hypothetical protein